MTSLTNHDIINRAREACIPYFRNVYMKDSLPKTGVLERECGVVNLDNSQGKGTHWVCYYKNQDQRIYFDSFGQVTPIEIQTYLKTKHEISQNIAVIQRNTDIVQHINTTNCGHLCLFVLEELGKGVCFQQVLNKLRQRYGYSQNNQ